MRGYEGEALIWMPATQTYEMMLLGVLLCGKIFPWSQTPEFANCRGFHVYIAWAADILHLFHLGTGRDLVGSSLKVLVKMRYFEESSIEISLGRATASLKRFAKNRGYSFDPPQAHQAAELRHGPPDSYPRSEVQRL